MINTSISNELKKEFNELFDFYYIIFQDKKYYYVFYFGNKIDSVFFENIANHGSQMYLAKFDKDKEQKFLAFKDFEGFHGVFGQD